MSEVNDEIFRKDRSEALKQKEALADLLKSPGWSMVSAMLAEQKQVRIVKLLTEPNLEDKELHFMRGEASTYELLQKWPQTMLEVASNILEALRGTDERPSQPAPVTESGRFNSIDDVDLPADPEQLAADERAGGSTDTWEPNRPANGRIGTKLRT